MDKILKELISLHIGEDEYKIIKSQSITGEESFLLYKNDALYAIAGSIFTPARYLVELWDLHEGGKQ